MLINRKGEYMKSVKIKLDDIESVKKFVNILTQFDCDFDLVSNRYVIDAKSIMGIFSLDLKDSIQLDIHEEEPMITTILDHLKEYRVSK